MKNKKIHEIVPDSTVKATKDGYFYCETDPPHPHGEKRKDRKKRYVYLHRALMEQKLGRYLESDEQVDHKDGDLTNNDPSNLEVVKRGPHQKDHVTRGNKFWEKSPRNKPKKKKKASTNDLAYRVLIKYYSKS